MSSVVHISCVAFDNRRVLHGRTSFAWSNDNNEEEVGRHLKGIYVGAEAADRNVKHLTLARQVEGDSVREKWRVAASKLRVP